MHNKNFIVIICSNKIGLQNMEANEVMTGIDHFFRNLLPKAYASVEWDEDSIINAFHWAEYCEKIYKSYQDKPSRNKLDEVIHSYGLKFSDIDICFEDLKKCTNMLCEAFFENPYVENYRVKTVLTKLNKDISSWESIEKGSALDSYCIELLESLKSIKITDSDRNLSYETKAEWMLNALKNVTHAVNLSEDQAEYFLSSCLEDICTSQDQMVFLYILVIKLPEEMSSEIAIQEFATRWLIYNTITKENYNLLKFIWKHLSMLRSISLHNRDFLTFYLDFLATCSSSLICESWSGEDRWVPRDAKAVLSFDEILEHFRSLLKYDDEVCDFTKNHLLTVLNTQQDLNIWKEIYSRVT